jgi:hypothetical protein
MKLRLSRNSSTADGGSAARRRAGRLLALGFLFFLAKGLIWIAVGGGVIFGVLAR